MERPIWTSKIRLSFIALKLLQIIIYPTLYELIFLLIIFLPAVSFAADVSNHIFLPR